MKGKGKPMPKRQPQRTVPSSPSRNPKVAKTGQQPFKAVRPYGPK